MILVTTPTGNTGRALVRMLVEAGEPVRVLARKPAKLPADLVDKLEVVQGSMTEPDAMLRAAEGAQAMFFCIPQADDADDVLAHYGQFAHAAAEAARQAGVPRVVYLGGAGKASPLAQGAGTSSALFHAEDILAGSGLALRTLRCPVFYESTLWQIGPISEAGMMFGLVPGSYPHGQVAVRDIAAAAAHYLSDTSWGGVEGVGVFGPQDVSMDQIAGWIAQAIDKPVHYQQISREAYVGNLVGFGVSAALANAVADMFEAIAGGLFDAEPRGFTPEGRLTMPNWVEQVFAPAYAQPAEW